MWLFWTRRFAPNGQECQTGHTGTEALPAHSHLDGALREDPGGTNPQICGPCYDTYRMGGFSDADADAYD